MRTTRTPQASPRAGYSAIELAFSVTIFVVVLLSSLAMVDRDTHLARSALGIGAVENMAQEMLFELEKELVNATAKDTTTWLATAVGTGDTPITVGSTRGFPPQSELVIDRENGGREVVGYTTWDFGAGTFTGLDRGLECTSDTGHGDNSSVFWNGWAQVLDVQPAPGVALLNTNQALEPTGGVFYRGAGTGFAYRVPIDINDPVDGTNYLSGDDITWGAVLNGQDPLDCDMALYFAPRAVISEVTTGDDINRDGDTADVFDLGQIRRVIWNYRDPNAQTLDIGLGPTAILQERCNYGGDLDADGFGDPIFLWNDNNRQLHVRVFIVGQSVADVPVVRQVESIIYLRNTPEVEN